MRLLAVLQRTEPLRTALLPTQRRRVVLLTRPLLALQTLLLLAPLL